jgi:hypothetical protein
LFAGTLAVTGGALILASGFSSHSIMLEMVSLFKEKVSTLLPAMIQLIVGTCILALSVLIALGGITVILGGAAVLFQRRTLGRLLVAIGGGAGFIGLAIALGYVLITAGVASLLVHGEYWLGVLLAAVGRHLARKP